MFMFSVRLFSISTLTEVWIFRQLYNRTWTLCKDFIIVFTVRIFIIYKRLDRGLNMPFYMIFSTWIQMFLLKVFTILTNSNNTGNAYVNVEQRNRREMRQGRSFYW